MRNDSLHIGPDRLHLMVKRNHPSSPVADSLAGQKREQLWSDWICPRVHSAEGIEALASNDYGDGTRLAYKALDGTSERGCTRRKAGTSAGTSLCRQRIRRSRHHHVGTGSRRPVRLGLAMGWPVELRHRRDQGPARGLALPQHARPAPVASLWQHCRSGVASLARDHPCQLR